ncbi:hypothetical protein ACIRYZ_19105 [Kitasatospora sp. NPDC101155]|uniref:hypothetical protein n=1 Tax=Kitasatospora sp. NPDC101155 TaxID=3364097 RepID=UPI003811D184
MTISPAASAAPVSSRQVQADSKTQQGPATGSRLPSGEVAPKSSPLHVFNRVEGVALGDH